MICATESRFERYEGLLYLSVVKSISLPFNSNTSFLYFLVKFINLNLAPIPQTYKPTLKERRYNKMSTKKNVKCKICGKKYVSKDALIEHLGKAHSSSIPKDWSPARFENYLRTGKTEGHCVYCKKETTWNETTGKYNRMCGSEACKKKARELANKNYIGVHGKPYSINDPEQQKKMIYGRKNSGTYIFEDEDTGKKYKAMYDSSYGKDFLEMIDTFLNWDGADIIAPSPNTYWYEYEGKKHFYIPDVYSTSLNLEIELKDGGDNPNNHPKIQAVDKVKEEKKDAVMKSLKDQVNYIKICNKDYTEFFALLSRLKEKDVCQLPKWQSKLESITESCVTEEVDQSKVGRAKTFSYYHLEEKKKEYPWDEEQYYKTIDDSIKAELYNLANSESGEKEGKRSFYVYTMGKGYKSICLGKITVRWLDFYDKENSKYDYEWEETFGINKSLIDEEINPVTESSPLNPVSYIKRNHKLTHPMLNYDDLIEYYRKQLFHKRLKPLEWQALYNELVGVKEYLQRVSNETDRPDNRMAYESRKALKEIEGFIQYMEQKNDDKLIESTMESSFNKSNKVPIYIVSWNYGSFVGNMVKLTTSSVYNHTSIALTSDLEDCYTFSRNPETAKSHSTNGFCRESLSYIVNRYGDCTIKVDAVYISKSNYKKLKNIINEYKKHESDTSFDYVNFARILFNIEKEDLDENKLNCSVFTDLVLKKSGIDVTNGKSSNLVTPSDLSNLDKTNKNVFTVYNGLASEYNSSSILNDIIKFNAQTNVMEYIIPNGGNIIYKVTSDDFMNHYKLLTPNEFKKWNGGVCWDYVVYEADYFKKHFKNVKYETYFHCFIDGKTNPTHTFLLFYLNDKVYWFESSWKSHVGIWEFSNKDTALSFIVKELSKDLDHKPDNQVTIIYDALSSTMIGMGCVEYMEYMNSQKEIHYRTIRNPKPLNHYRGEESFDINQYATHESSLPITESSKIPNTASDYLRIVKMINSKTVSDEKPPVGNQNCQICTWCLEAQIRGYNVLPRPVYSPRDIIFTMNGYDIVKGAEKISIGSFKDVDTIVRSDPNSRYYVHINWKGSSSGHEFVVANINGKPYVLDGQAGIVTLIRSSEGMRYFNNANYKNSFMIRMDNKEFNESVLDFNDDKYILEWKDDDAKLLESTNMIVNEETSTLDKNFKKKSGKNFEYKSLSSNVDKYFKGNSYWEKFGKYHKENSIGEIAIDKETGELAGYIFVKNKRSGEEGFITPLEILPKYRGYGVSNKLVDDAIHKYGAIDLTVDIDNEVAINLYKKHGFVIIGYENEKTKKHYYMKLRSKLSKDESIISESTYIEGTKDNTKYYPVFIFLSYTGTNMAKLIKSFTHDPYAHSSISFDTELNHMVSFNREGMVEENINEKIWKKNKDRIKYSLYMYMASAEEYESMRNFVNELLGKKSKLRYNALGLTNFIFGRGSEREDKYFCSEFVASVISAGNANIIKTRPYMTSPYMLVKNKNFKFIKKGILKNYNSKVVDNLVKDILEERGFEDVTIK